MNRDTATLIVLAVVFVVLTIAAFFSSDQLAAILGRGLMIALAACCYILYRLVNGMG